MIARKECDQIMFRRHHRKRNPALVIFRLLLSLIIFALLIGGIYAAYKQFSGMDPKGIDPKALMPLLKIFSLTQEQKKSIIPQDNKEKSPIDKKSSLTKSLLFKFALLADSHNENNFLKSALQQAKENQVTLVIGLGDYTEVGTLKELQDAKNTFDEAGLRYFVTTGDHDLWDARNKQKLPADNFNQVFGPTFQTFSFEGVKFLILDNSDNYGGLSEDQIKWLKFEIDKVKQEKHLKLLMAFLHEPLYHPSSTRVMGKVEPKLTTQAKEVAQILKNGGVKEVFAGDTHYFGRYADPSSGLNMTTVGAITSSRNAQTPRFAIVTVMDNFEYTVEDVEIK